MSLTPQEILDIVDPTRQHENDTSFPHWYIVDGELVNIYNFEPADDPLLGSTDLWYIKETEDPDTHEVVKELDHPMLPSLDTSVDKPGYWYIKETVDPVTGEVTKELTNHGIPLIGLEVNGIWYVKDGSLTHAAFPELVEYGSYMSNQVVNKAIIFPSVMEVGEWAFKDTPSMLEVYLNPECKRYDTSFPEECVVKDWPLSARVTQMPTKTTYNVGEDFDVTGMKVLVTLDMTVMGKDYGSYAYEANNDYFTVVQFDNTSPGEKVVILRYKTPYSVGQYSVVLPEPVIVV
jgi:hypothetical protein